MGQAEAPPRNLRPVEGPASLATTGHVPLREQEQRGLGMCVFQAQPWEEYCPSLCPPSGAASSQPETPRCASGSSPPCRGCC